MNTQMELPVMGNCSYSMKSLPESDVARCPSIEYAYRLCMRKAVVKLTDEAWAKRLGVSKSYFSQILEGGTELQPRHMSWKIRSNIQKIAGNDAINQWESLELAGRLMCQSEDYQKEIELLEELEALRARRA